MVVLAAPGAGLDWAPVLRDLLTAPSATTPPRFRSLGLFKGWLENSLLKTLLEVTHVLKNKNKSMINAELSN